ncbi:MAG: hypothetical protein ACRD4P_14505, partial [Bryobacteraceae bacterium]
KVLCIPSGDSGVRIVLVIDRNGLEVFRLENLIAVQTPDVIDPITPREDLCAVMLTDHKKGELPLF